MGDTRASVGDRVTERDPLIPTSGDAEQKKATPLPTSLFPLLLEIRLPLELINVLEQLKSSSCV
jgi:hypothetical protein